MTHNAKPASSHPICLLVVLLAAACLGAPVLASGMFLDFSLEPAAPDTGNPVRFRAEIELTSCCTDPDVMLSFGPQEELGGARGWGIDVVASTGAIPVITIVPVERDLGPLQPGSGEGVLRLLLDGVVADVEFFTLEVSPGPAPGWRQIALHGGFSRFTQGTALTALPDRIALNDQSRRSISLVDPVTGVESTIFPSPGSGDVRGLAFDGTNLLVSVFDFAAARVYTIDLLGRVLGSFPSPVVSPGNAPLEGLAMREGILYGTYPGPPILFAINPSTGAKIWERSLPTRILGLAPVPEGLLGVEQYGQFYFIEAESGGEDLLLADAADHGITGLPNLQALAYDGFGTFAWDANSARAQFIRTFALWWDMDGTMQYYVPAGGVSTDVIRGTVGGLQQLSGNVGLGRTTCVVGDGSGGAVPTPENPPAGEAFYYLARFMPAGGFDQSYGRSTLGFRRFDFENACP